MNFKRMLPLSLLLLSLPSFASGVISLSPEQTVKTADGEDYVEVQINCRGRKESRAIWQKQDASTKEWCARDIAGFCARSKMAAAKKVCTTKYSRALEEHQVAPSATASTPEVITKPMEPASKAPAVVKNTPEKPQESTAVAAPEAAKNLELQKHQLSIEKERLAVEQKRLELQKQQIELKKQELKLKRELETSGANTKTGPGKQSATETQQPAEAAGKPSVQKNVIGM